jgi:hypothetical protein
MLIHANPYVGGNLAGELIHVNGRFRTLQQATCPKAVKENDI